MRVVSFASGLLLARSHLVRAEPGVLRPRQGNTSGRSISGSTPTSSTTSSLQSSTTDTASITSFTSIPSVTDSPSATTTAPECSGQTLNVLLASLDWWYNTTVYDVVSTLSAQFDNDSTPTGWTLLPATTTFDLTAALVSPPCSSTLTFDAQRNISLYSVTCSAAATPVAAQTTVISQTAYQHPGVDGGFGTSLPNVVATPAPAAISLPPASGAFGQGTAFVFFDQYEIITKAAITDVSGSSVCVTQTSTYQMPTPQSFAYEGPDVNGTDVVNAGVSGDVDPALLAVVNTTGVVAGSWVAAPTVAIVVQKVIAAVLLPSNQAEVQISAAQLQTVVPTKPSFLTPFGAPPTQWPVPPNTPHQETSANSLALPPSPPPISPPAPIPTTPPQPKVTEPEPSPNPVSPTAQTTLVPFVAGQGPQRTTLAIDVPDTLNTVTASYNGGKVTAIRLPNEAPSPTDALQVLSEALDTATAQFPTATAIFSDTTSGNTMGTAVPTVPYVGGAAKARSDACWTASWILAVGLWMMGR